MNIHNEVNGQERRLLSITTMRSQPGQAAQLEDHDRVSNYSIHNGAVYKFSRSLNISKVALLLMRQLHGPNFE